MYFKRQLLAVVALHCLAMITMGAEPKPAFLGVRLGDSDNADVKGSTILEVFDDTAAAEAKLRVNDIVTAIGDVHIDSDTSLIEQIGKLTSGTKTTFKIVRDGEEKEIGLTLRSRPNYSLVLRQRDPPRVHGGTFNLATGGTIKSDVTNGGNVILPNGVGNIVGNYEQNWRGLLDVNLDQQAVLNVTGDVSVSGILYIGMEKTKPKFGDKFEIIRDASSLDGTFGKLFLPPLPNDLDWEIIYDSIPNGIDLDADGKHDITLVVKMKNER